MIEHQFMHYAALPSEGRPRFRVKAMRFIPHTGRAHHRRRAISSATTIDRFADLIADGVGVTAAARQLGVTPTYGNAMLQRLRARLGSQSV